MANEPPSLDEALAALDDGDLPDNIEERFKTEDPVRGSRLLETIPPPDIQQALDDAFEIESEVDAPPPPPRSRKPPPEPAQAKHRTPPPEPVHRTPAPKLRTPPPQPVAQRSPLPPPTPRAPAAGKTPTPAPRAARTPAPRVPPPPPGSPLRDEERESPGRGAGAARSKDHRPGAGRRREPGDAPPPPPGSPQRGKAPAPRTRTTAGRRPPAAVEPPRPALATPLATTPIAMPTSPPPTGTHRVLTQTPAPVPIPSRKSIDLVIEAQAMVRACQAEMENQTDPTTIARLNLEIAQVSEDLLADEPAAQVHYKDALAAAPDSLPALRGARRTALATGDLEGALPLFDEEVRLIGDNRVKAAMLYEKGRLLEDGLGRPTNAAKAYSEGLDLDPKNLSLLKATTRLAATRSDWDLLTLTYERAANAASDDPRLRAAYMVQRAHLAETHDSDTGAAIDLYESALRLDPQVLGAIAALKRLYHKNRDWSHLVTVLEREAEQTTDDRIRAISLHHAARLFLERLGDRDAARAALAHAAKATENRDRLILEDLAHLDEAAGDHDSLVRVLEVLVQIIAEPSERVELLHRMGIVLEKRLHDTEQAIRAYQAALSFDPAHVPTLRSLGSLLSRRGEWTDLIDMLMRESDAVDEDTRRRAQAHSRIADILDGHLHRPTDAIDHYARALSLWPAHEEARRALTRLYAQSGRFRELVELYERALDLTDSPTRKAAYLFKIGSILEDSLHDPANAAYAYQRMLELEPSHLIAVHAIQRVTEQAERWDDLVASLEQEAQKTDDNDLIAALLHRAGTVLDEHLDNRDAAVSRFRNILEIKPDYKPALSGLGRIYHRTGRWDDLLEIYERELELDPERGDATIMLYKMAELCEAHLGRDDDAIDYYRRAVKLDPGYRPAVSALVRKLRDRDAWDELVEIHKLEVDGIRDPRAKAYALWSAGAVYEEHLDQIDDAIACFERARKIEPSFWPATLALNRLHDEKQSWRDLVGDLDLVARGIQDEVVAGAALLRQGAILRDQLRDKERAIDCFEALGDMESGKLPALFALQNLYAEAGAWDALANSYAIEANSVSDPAARVAALRELARVQEVKGSTSVADVTTTYGAILGAAPDDQGALLALQRIARERGDDAVLAKVCHRLSKAAGNPELSARYLTRMGHVREAARDAGAISAYRTALDEDPRCLAAIRGLARTAEVTGDHRALAEAWRREADLLSDSRAASELLVKSALVRLEALEDTESAVRDLERALDTWPDSQIAAERLCGPLLAAGRADYLIDVLSRAAGSAQDNKAKAEHWVRVAEVRIDHKDDLHGALTSLDRALEEVPEHLPALRKLASLYFRDRRYREAANTYGRAIALADQLGEPSWRLQLRLAQLYHEHLDDPGRAQACLTAVIEQGDASHPGYRDALVALADMQVASGDANGAAQTAKRMVESADDDPGRSQALVFWAEIETSRGDLERAERALAHAIALSGSHGDAARAYCDLVANYDRGWPSYIKGLTTYIQRLCATQPVPPDLQRDLIHAYLELAHTHSERMGLPRNAIANLEEALTTTNRHPAIIRDLIPRLRDANRAADAVTMLRGLLSEDLTDANLWRSLAETLDLMNRPIQAELHLAPLMIMGVADADEQARLKKHRSQPGAANPQSFDSDLLERIAAEQAMSQPAAELLAALAESVSKIHPPNLEAMNLSRRDRLTSRSRHPMRAMADKVAEAFEVEFDLYVHDLGAPAVAVELTEPPAILVAESVGERREVEQVFLLTYAIAPVAGRFHPAQKLSAEELELLLAGAARTVDPNFGDDLVGMNSDELDQMAQRVRKALPRKWRKAVEAAAHSYAAKPVSDMAAWRTALDRTAIRAALLMAGDLPTAVSILQKAEKLSDVTGPDILRRSAAIADLVQYWVADKTLALRRELGLIS